jgi:hypothetical protein
MSEKPNHQRDWLRQKLWPFPRRASEGEDSVLPHLQEFLDSSIVEGGKPPAPREEKKDRGDKPTAH